MPTPLRRPRSCWEVASRRAAQARERRRRRRGRGVVPSPAAIVRDLTTGVEGVFIVALAMTMAMAVIEMAAGLWRQPAPPPPIPSPSRRAAVGLPPETVHGLPGFSDAFPGENLSAYQARHRPEAAGRYRESARTQARWLHQVLAGDKRAVSRLTPELRDALHGIEPAVATELMMMSRERLAREVPAILAGHYTAQPPGGLPPAEAPDVAPEDDGQVGGPPPGPRPPQPRGS